MCIWFGHTLTSGFGGFRGVVLVSTPGLGYLACLASRTLKF